MPAQAAHAGAHVVVRAIPAESANPIFDRRSPIWHISKSSSPRRRSLAMVVVMPARRAGLKSEDVQRRQTRRGLGGGGLGGGVVRRGDGGGGGSFVRVVDRSISNDIGDYNPCRMCA